jgi:hypothetical protein
MMESQAAEQSGYMPIADGLAIALQAAGIKVCDLFGSDFDHIV